MDLPMNQDKIKDLVDNFPAEKLQSDEIESFIQQMRKRLIEQALQGEMDAHLGYDRYERRSGSNSRNGSSRKILKTEKGPIPISVPRDREGSFEPQIVPKGQTRTGVLDDQIIHLYSKGMSTREISETIKELYDVDVSATLISNVGISHKMGRRFLRRGTRTFSSSGTAIYGVSLIHNQLGLDALVDCFKN